MNPSCGRRLLVIGTLAAILVAASCDGASLVGLWTTITGGDVTEEELGDQGLPPPLPTGVVRPK